MEDQKVTLQKLTAEQLEAMTKEDLKKFIADAEATAAAVIDEAKQALLAKEQQLIAKYGKTFVEGAKMVLLAAILGKVLGWF